MKGSRGAAGRGPVWWRAGLGGEGRASQQIPPWRLDEGGAQAAVERRGGPEDARQAAEGAPTATRVRTVAGKNEKPIGQMATGKAWRRPEVWPRDPEAASAVARAPACLSLCCRDAALAAVLAFSVAG